MDLVIVLGFFVREHEIQRHLIRLIHDRAMARGHFADVEMQHAGNGLQIFYRAGHQFIGGLGLGGIGPEDDDVGEKTLHV